MTNTNTNTTTPPTGKTLIEFPNYIITANGQIWSIKHNKFLSPSISYKNGYYQVNLRNNGKSHSRKIHSLVTEAFLGERPEGTNVNHINGIKLDNNIQNLEYITQKQNVEHAMKLGLIRVGDDSVLAKYDDATISKALRHYELGVSKKVICEHYNISQQYLNQVLNGKLRKHLLAA